MMFRTVFDAAREGDSIWWFPAFGLIFVAVGALLVFRPALMQRYLRSGLQGTFRTIFSWCFFLFALLWTTGSFVITGLQHHAATSLLSSGQYAILEGPVSNFVPMPYAGHAMESFTVGGRRFSYSDYVVTAGFHNTASHGGPIREGLYVRIAYSGNLILRLDIAQ